VNKLEQVQDCESVSTCKRFWRCQKYSMKKFKLVKYCEDVWTNTILWMLQILSWYGAQKATLTSNIKKCEDVRTREDCQSVLTCNTKKNEREHV
jgi:hypothetical protein